MQKRFRLCYVFPLLAAVAIFGSFYHRQPAYRFPYQKAGLSKAEAAAHLLSRFSFGARPGDIEAVTRIGLEEWFAQQLEANVPDANVEQAVAGYDSWGMTTAEIVKTYPRPAQVLRAAVQAGGVHRDSVKLDKREGREALRSFMAQNGLKPQQELLRQLAAQKIIRAAYSNNQLKETLTDFWFNHFNVAASKGGIQQYLTAYERDAIRPNVLRRFEDLLLATAKSPAMLVYLDNNKSAVNEDEMDDRQQRAAKRQGAVREKMADRMMAAIPDTAVKRNLGGKIKKPKQQGLNENYAREIMELHTLGVEGGYTQADVTAAARILTGWSLNPLVEYNLDQKRLPAEQRLQNLGFVYDDNFLFHAMKHDRGAKTVMGVPFPAGGGYEEGVRLIGLLASHPSTAKFISKKLAVRFVSDAPPQSLVDKMAHTFLEKGGDIKAVLLTMVTAPEFWDRQALRQKTKSPFEVAISAIRATGAQVSAPLQLYQWTAKMGQQLYNYQAPTGFPDRGQYWINTGSLLNRMNFGLAFASGRIPGVKVDLLALNKSREPESAEEALTVYSQLLLPERNLAETVKRLTPLLTDPALQQKVNAAAGEAGANLLNEDEDEPMEAEGRKKIGGKKNGNLQPVLINGNNSLLAQVVGIIIGSPEFQRR